MTELKRKDSDSSQGKIEIVQDHGGLSAPGEDNPREVFNLLEKLGEGSYGSVWRGEHKVSKTEYAIKRIGVDNDLEDLLVEIQFMRGCENEHIVRYFGSYATPAELWIVMEYCSAGSVADVMKATKRCLSEAQIRAVAQSTLQGLAYLHSMHKIHRDVKCGNILLNSRGVGKLTDFGVSGQLADTMAKRHTVIGTPFWMAPEVIEETGYNEKADIWSFGITVIEMAEGRPPYANVHPMRAIFMIPNKPPPAFARPDDWSPDLNNFLAQCLVKDPAARPTAAQLLEHPFLRGPMEPSRESLLDIIRQQEEIIARDGRKKALGLDGEVDNGDQCESTLRVLRQKTGTLSSTNTPLSTNRRLSNASESDDSSSFSDDSDGTAIVYSDVDDDDSDDEEWRKRFEGARAERKKRMEEYASMDRPLRDVPLDELRKRIAALDAERNAKINEIVAQYKKKQQELLVLLQQVRSAAKGEPDAK